VSTERALFVQHDQLADQARRLAQLRTELRRARDRASEAEDALDTAEGRFEIALLAQRQEVQDARERATRAEDGRAADRSALETLEAEVTAAREALDRERAVRFEVEGRALEAEQAIAATREELGTSRAAAANAVAQADAMRRALEDERGMRSDSEVRLTWAEARLEDKAERIAELEEDARRRGVELDAERAAEAQRARALDDELAAARDATGRERTVRVKAEGRALEWEQSAGAMKIELDRSWEAAVAAVAEVDAVRRVLEEERSGRAEAEARLEERSARSDRLEQELAAAEEQRQALEVALSEAQAALAEQPAAVVEPEPEPELAAETPAEEPAAEQQAPPGAVLPGTIGARLIALDMALNGTPREETARYLEDTVAAEDEREALLDELYAHRTATA
jgi:chromosome segregation ATPase